MGFDGTILGQIILGWMVISSFLVFYLAKRKTGTPLMSVIINLLLSFIPLLSLIYIAVLSLKSDLVEKQE